MLCQNTEMFSVRFGYFANSRADQCEIPALSGGVTRVSAMMRARSWAGAGTWRPCAGITFHCGGVQVWPNAASCKFMRLRRQVITEEHVQSGASAELLASDRFSRLLQKIMTHPQACISL